MYTLHDFFLFMKTYNSSETKKMMKLNKILKKGVMLHYTLIMLEYEVRFQLDPFVTIILKQDPSSGTL